MYGKEPRHSEEATAIDSEKGLKAGFTDCLTTPPKVDTIMKSLDACPMTSGTLQSAHS